MNWDKKDKVIRKMAEALQLNGYHAVNYDFSQAKCLCCGMSLLPPASYVADLCVDCIIKLFEEGDEEDD